MIGKKLSYRLFEVGGKIRDEILGKESKDVDYSVVVEESTIPITILYEKFVEQLKDDGYEVFLIEPDCFTVRAKFPEDHKYSGVADFVLARKETSYIEGTRKPVSEIGTLHDDLERRDFTMNAIAKDEDGSYVDPFGGVEDMANGIIKTPRNAVESFNDDPLRIIRAFRFAITKDLQLSDDIWMAIRTFKSDKLRVVSNERIREELFKCFKFDTKETLSYLFHLREINTPLFDAMLPREIWLEPTNRK